MTCCNGRRTCACQIAAGANVTVSGDGSTADPYVIAAAGGGGGPVTCDDVRPCLSAGPGASYDPLTGVVGGRLSADAGNAAVYGGDGGIYTPAGLSSVTAGCGLDGAGTAGDPLVAATSGTWPLADRLGQSFPCPDGNATSEVYCASDGTLHTRPEGTCVIGVFGPFVEPPTPDGFPLDMSPGQVYTFTQDIPYRNFSTCRYLHTLGVAAATVTLTVGADAHWRVYMSPVCSVDTAPLGPVVMEDVWNGPADKPWIYTASGVDHEFNMPPGTDRIYQFRVDVECVAGPVSLTSISGNVRYHGTTI